MSGRFRSPAPFPLSTPPTPIRARDYIDRRSLIRAPHAPLNYETTAYRSAPFKYKPTPIRCSAYKACSTSSSHAANRAMYHFNNNSAVCPSVYLSVCSDTSAKTAEMHYVRYYYPPFASIAKGEVFVLLYVFFCFFVCSVNDFSAPRGPIHAIFCMRA